MQTIVFDFGNVIAFFDHYQALAQLTPYTDLTAQAMYDAVYGTDLEDALESGRLTRSDFLQQLKELWRLHCDVDFLARAVVDIFTLNPEVCALLPRLKKRYRLLLGSNTNELHAAQMSAQFAAILGLFDTLVLSHQIGARKPKQEFYQRCQAHALGTPAECVFVDDLPVNIEAARQFGWQGIVYRPGENLAGQLENLGVHLEG